MKFNMSGQEFFGELIGGTILILSGFIFKNGFITGITLALLIIIGESFYSVSFNPMIATAHYLSGIINLEQFKFHLFAELLAAIIAFIIYDKYLKKNGL
jgi:hypothetical protein